MGGVVYERMRCSVPGISVGSHVRTGTRYGWTLTSGDVLAEGVIDGRVRAVRKLSDVNLAGKARGYVEIEDDNGMNFLGTLVESHVRTGERKRYVWTLSSGDVLVEGIIDG